jgi:hypothetical protein
MLNGGGLYIEGSYTGLDGAAKVTNSKFKNNRALFNGGGLAAINVAVDIESCKFFYNEAGYSLNDGEIK